MMSISATPLLLCYHVWVNPTNGNVNLQEVFTNLRVTGRGARPLPISAYALLIGEPGEVAQCELEAIEEETGRAYAQAEGIATIGESGRRHLRVLLDRYNFPRPGPYRFVLRVNGHEIAEYRIFVREVNE